MYVQRTENKDFNGRRKIAKNETKNFKIYLEGKTFKFDYSVDKLNEILKSGIFDKIQIPVYAHNSILFGAGKKGVCVIGNIVSYDEYLNEFTVNIFARFASKIKSIEDPIIYPRVIRMEDEISIKILGFDVGSYEFYTSNINRKENEAE